MDDIKGSGYDQEPIETADLKCGRRLGRETEQREGVLVWG
jgi:hypothetical protein